MHVSSDTGMGILRLRLINGPVWSIIGYTPLGMLCVAVLWLPFGSLPAFVKVTGLWFNLLLLAVPAWHADKGSTRLYDKEAITPLGFA